MIIYAKSCKEESTFEVMLKCFLGEAVCMISSQCKMQLCQAVTEYVLPDLWEVTRMQGNYELPWVKIWFWFFIVVNCRDNECIMNTESHVWHGSTAFLVQDGEGVFYILFPDPLLVCCETRTPKYLGYFCLVYIFQIT